MAQVIKEGLPVEAPVDDVARTGEKPNILLICTDQHRHDWLGVHGHPWLQTPQLDQLFLSGIDFRGAISECPVCCPARRVLLTGRDPFGVNMFYNRDLQPFPEGPKLAALLGQAGYQAHAVGKMHVWPPRNRVGFDDVELNEEGRTAGHVFPDDYTQFVMDRGLGPVAYSHGLGNNEYGARANPLPEDATTTGWTADRAMRFLRRRDPERPFFLYVSFDKPHPPATPPQRHLDLYRDAEYLEPVVGDWVAGKPLARRTRMELAHNWEQWSGRPDVIRDFQRGYAGTITHIDDRIGQLLGTLRETGVLANTWIGFVSDHGDHVMDHGLLAKGDCFAGSTRVPFALVPAETWMDRVDHACIGSSSFAAVGLQDVMPTLLELAGAPVPGDIDGISLLPHFGLGDGATRAAVCGYVGSQLCACDGKHRFAFSGEDGHEWLFDQEADPRDERDLVDDPGLSKVVDRLRAALVAWLADHDDPHVVGGKLTVVPVAHQGGAVGHRSNHWNNRGWRG